MSNQMKGTFIVFEGGEGSGKDTQIDILKEKLPTDTVFTREPGGTELAEKLRILLLKRDTPITPRAELMLFCAARADHVERVIAPALAAGKLVVSNRFDFSTIAYQVYGRERLDLLADFRKFNTAAVANCQPDLYLYLQLSVEVSLRRVAERKDNDRFDAEAQSFHQRVKDGYDILAKKRDKCITVDASQSIDDVSYDISHVLQSHIH
jgi:dTMP kinase